MYKQQVKALFKNLSKGHNEASKMSIETGPYIFHYIIEGRVVTRQCVTVLIIRNLPFDIWKISRMNLSVLMELKLKQLPGLMPLLNSKTKKLYLDTCTQRNIAKLNDELYEVHQIMTRNVQVLGVGEKLDHKFRTILGYYIFFDLIIN
ncbi:25.3 kDa vesicle transport protein-like [Hibiscus syriacus]|uniref:25.3 kDa vesicle transport protein-like n=1 Tax=Hibiscus syriacus TaxID=106335 RepID=UPI001920CDB0|nr:25.3 kDa vesicle transport protein-like [Hibiscus syriacus]